MKFTLIIAAFFLTFPICCFPTVSKANQPYAHIEFHSMQSENTFEQMPLTTNIETDINSIVARTRITQTFKNNTVDWLEGVYRFPLPEDAAVDTLLMHIGERIIEGEIQEKQQAEKTYQQAKAQGQKASLVKQERANLFTTKLANIAPNETIKISIEFQQLIRVDGTQFSLRMPLGITPRYEPSGKNHVSHQQNEVLATDDNDLYKSQAATESPLPKTVTQFNTEQQPKRSVYFNINLNPGFDLSELTSPSHTITSQQYADRYQITLQNPAQAEQDFILNWQPQLGQTPKVALFSEIHNGFNYHLLMMVPPTHDLIQQQIQPREMIFVVDSSGSMSGQSMHQAQAGLRYALSQLNSQDSFNIIDFDHQARNLFADAVPVSDQHLVLANNFIDNLDANGGTEIASAVNQALTKPNSDKLRQVIFMTDGSIGNEQQIFSLIQNRLGNNRLFTVGIGAAPNSYFMKKAAEHGRGTFTYIANVNEVKSKLNTLFEKLRYPVLSSLQLQQGPLATIDLQPKYLPDLYLGEVLYASYRIPIGTNFPLQIQGKTDSYSWNFDLPAVVNGHDQGVAKLWARMKIESLTNELHHKGSDSQQIKQSITDTALTFHLVSDYTSLVAVDKTPARAQEHLKQLDMKNRLPKGSAAPKVHGYPQGATDTNLMLLIGLLSLFLAALFFFYDKRRPHELA
ncbi:MAG: marine proteobacterial sortase target protein [Kangiellaceae bacterium]|nr:marine proteobacterial sortase target protein [Kangiellaceae bacterium]